MRNVKGRIGKVLRTKLFALNPEDKLIDSPPVKVDIAVHKEIDDIRVILYTVQDKDTISSVAEKFNVSTVDIIFANQLYNNQILYPGQVLYVYEELTLPSTTENTNTTSTSTTATPVTSPFTSPIITPISSPSITALPEIHQLISLFPPTDSALLETTASYRLLLSNLRVLYDTNINKSALPSVLAMKLNVNELLDEIKEHVIYVSSRENQRANGMLTATPRQIIFEPDWDSPLVEQGLLNYRIQMSISDIIDCHMILEKTPPPLYEMELQFFDYAEEEDITEGQKESYLQISVQSGVDPRVIRFVVPSERLSILYQKIMAWTGRPILTPRVPSLPSVPASSTFSPPSSVPNSARASPILRSTASNVSSIEPSLFSAASRFRSMYQPDLDVIKERVTYINSKLTKPVKGVVTLTSNMVIFEPDLDDPTVVQHGLIANQVNFFMADVYECVFQNPTTPAPSPPVSPRLGSESPFLSLAGDTSEAPKLHIIMRDGSSEKIVLFIVDKDKADPLVAKITQHMGGRPKDRARTTPLSISPAPSPPTSVAPSPSISSATASPPTSPNPFSLGSSPAAIFSSLKNSNILSKISSLSKSTSDLTASLNDFDLMVEDEITPQQRMIKEIEDYDVKFSHASQLINQDRAKFLRRYLNSSLAFHDWTLLYSTNIHGISLNTMYAKTKEKGGVFIIIQDTNRNVFGGFASESLHLSSRYYGTGESFLFKLAPALSVYPWPNSNSFFILTTENFISMGGGEAGKYGFWLDADFQKGSSGYSNTFHNPPLSDKETFECLVLEIWCVS